MHVKQGPYFVGQGGAFGHGYGPNVLDFKMGTSREWRRARLERGREVLRRRRVDDSQFAGFTFDHCDGLVLASGEECPDLWRIEVTYQPDPAKAVALLESCARAQVPEPELKRFLEDLARVVPAEHRAQLEQIVASS